MLSTTSALSRKLVKHRWAVGHPAGRLLDGVAALAIHGAVGTLMARGECNTVHVEHVLQIGTVVPRICAEWVLDQEEAALLDSLSADGPYQ